MNKKVVIVEAMGESIELPGLFLKKILSRPLIQIVVDQIKLSKRVDEVVVLTSGSDQDLVKFCKDQSIPVHQSRSKSLLDAYHDVAKTFLADTVVRVKGNCPLTQASIIDAMVVEFDRKVDYFSNCQPVQTVPAGLDIEIFSSLILEEIRDEVREDKHRQAVTSYIYEQPDLFKLQSFELYSELSELDFSIKNIDDFVFMSKVCTDLGEQKFNSGDFDIIDAVNAYNQVVLSQ